MTSFHDDQQPTQAEAEVLTEQIGQVLLVTINRPSAMNSVTPGVCRGIADALMFADSSDEIRAIVVTGSGSKVFCAGGDLKSIAQGIGVVPEEEPYVSFGFGGMTERTARVPVIVAVNGSAFGGGVEMMLSADIVVAEKETIFGLPEVTRGLIAAASGVYKLPDLLPRAVALDLLLTGEPISSERAFSLGLVSRLVDRGCALNEALAIANTIAANGPLAVQATKRLARELESDGTSQSDRERQELLNAEFALLLQSSDARAGARAFATKQTPVFTGA